LYDHSINKIIPYVFVNNNKTPILLDETFANYDMLNVHSNEASFKIFPGSYMFTNGIFVQVEDIEWAWDHSNSMVMPSGMVNSFYMLIENKGHKNAIFSISFTEPTLCGKSYELPLKNNVGFSVMTFPPTKQSHGNFNERLPGQYESLRTTPPTDGILTLELNAGYSCAIQYTILQLPQHVPRQDYSQYVKVTEISENCGKATVLF
jgi:hypothetical protein